MFNTAGKLKAEIILCPLQLKATIHTQRQALDGTKDGLKISPTIDNQLIKNEVATQSYASPR